MNDLARWQQHNDTYLSAAIAWLRRRLEQLAEGEPHAEKPFASAPASFALVDRLLRRSPAGSAPAVAALPPASSAALDDQRLARASEALAVAEAAEPPPALSSLHAEAKVSRAAATRAKRRPYRNVCSSFLPPRKVITPVECRRFAL